jgi:hypothetical protein
MTMQKKKDMQETQKSFWRLTQKGSSDCFERNGDENMKEVYMMKNNLKYKADPTLDDKKGCIARMATPALRNL